MVVTSKSIQLEKIVWGRRIEIPPIQRDYAWTTKGDGASATQLIEDLISFHGNKNNTGNYYLGNFIIVVENPDKLDELYESEGTEDMIWNLLDGQQRLTSLTMIYNSIYIILNESSDPRAPHICNDIKSRFIFADPDRFDTTEWKGAIYPRREETRDFLSWLIHECMEDPKNWVSPDGKEMTNIQQAAILFHKYLRKLCRSKGAAELIKFYETLSERVIVSLTITDEASMGFQMFQTANSRGTPLTSYDMFRAFCIKRAQVDLELPEPHQKAVVALLNTVEITMRNFGKKDEEIDKEVKSIMTAWMICRDGKRHKESVIIRKIEDLVNSLDSFGDMLGVIHDLSFHTGKWLYFKSKSPLERADSPRIFGNSGRKSWITIGRFEELGMKIFWPMVLALRCAEDDEGGSPIYKCANKEFTASDSLVDMLQWSIVRGILCKNLPMSGKTQAIENELVKDCNLIWNSYQGSGSEPVMDQAKIRERMQYWQLDHPLKENPTGFRDMEEIEFGDKDGKHKYAKIILHLLDSGMSNTDPRSTGQKIHIAKIFPPNRYEFNYLAEDESNLLGNFVLLRGSANNGVSQDYIKKTLDRLPFNKRMKELIKLSSDDGINQNLRHISDPSGINRFIRIRTQNLQNKLEKKWKEFSESNGVQFIS